MLIGWQLCLFTGRAARLSIENRRDHPDTVYVYLPAASAHYTTQERSSQASAAGGQSPTASASMLESEAAGRIAAEKALRTEYRPASHSPVVQQVRRQKA